MASGAVEFPDDLFAAAVSQAEEGGSVVEVPEHVFQDARPTPAQALEECRGIIRFHAMRARRRAGLPLEDGMQAGRLGVLISLPRFDPARGVRLVSYAAWYVRLEVRNAALLLASFGPQPKDLCYYRKHGQKAASLHRDDDAALQLEAEEEAVLDLEEAGKAKAALMELRDRDRRALYEVVGLGRSKAEVARELGVSRERVRQLVVRAMTTMKKRCR